MSRKDITPRYFAAPEPLKTQLCRLVESTQQTIDTIPLVEYRWIRGVVAPSSTGDAFITIPWSATPPDAVCVDRIFPTASPQTMLSSTLKFNFTLMSGQITIYRPSGLTSGTTYDLLVRVVSGVGG